MARVSIGLPVFNGEKYLAVAIESILAQSYGDFDLLISDNASTDNTAEIARQYCSQDDRVSYHRQEKNLGAAANFNYVFNETRGEYFRWASYDDAIAPDYLAECVSRLDADDGSAVLAYPETMIVDSNGLPLRRYDAVTRKGGATASGRLEQMIGRGEHFRSILHFCFPVFGLMRRDALRKTSLIANMPRSDHLLLVELALLGAFIEIDRPLFLRREHDAGSVIAAEKKAKTSLELERLLAAWFDPARGRAFPATVTRLGMGYLKAVVRTPMSPGEKMACIAIVLGWIRRHWRMIGGECKIVIRESIGL